MPVISVIIPIYNTEPYLLNCLESCARQSYKDFELILVNDCTLDNSMAVVDKFIQDNPDCACRVVKMERNSGQSAARNRGIKEAKGEYIYFLDSDDSIMENCFEQLITVAVREDLEMVTGENYIVKGAGYNLVEAGFDGVIRGNGKILSAFINGLWYNVPWNKLIKSQFIKDNNLYFKEGYIFEDELWSFCVATGLRSMGIIKIPLYNYFVRPNSTMTSNLDYKRWNGMMKILPFMREKIFQENLRDNYEVAKFFLFKVIQTISGVDKAGMLKHSYFESCRDLNYVSISELYKNGGLTKREYLAYYYFKLPKYLAYTYYSLTKLYYKIR